MIRLYTAANLPEAYLLLHHLQASGVDARVFNENAQGGLGEIPFIHAYPEIWVAHDEDMPMARQIVEEFERREDTTGLVKCQVCGEDNPANFELCWHCGGALT